MVKAKSESPGGPCSDLRTFTYNKLCAGCLPPPPPPASRFHHAHLRLYYLSLSLSRQHAHAQGQCTAWMWTLIRLRSSQRTQPGLADSQHPPA